MDFGSQPSGNPDSNSTEGKGGVGYIEQPLTIKVKRGRGPRLSTVLQNHQVPEFRWHPTHPYLERAKHHEYLQGFSLVCSSLKYGTNLV